ncbi:hypothetical protein ZIOFF_030885 [Zingiber officinale]|uniref:DUF4219 domain-containing protein n=1 Tax=Zingiber officinale TaxID=94328 RepID=A0A8J5LC58_ZINOF|nr:hypothetical protein ZIOFF_030885 [Zingiber officinale]
MEGGGRIAGLGMMLLNQSNYRIWKTCMESYLVGEDLWDVVVINGVVAPEDAPANAEALKNWKQRNAKAEFVLKRSISHEIFEHIMGCASAREIWDTLDRLFNKKNEARLQLLENELAVAKQDGMSCSEFFSESEELVFGNLSSKSRRKDLECSVEASKTQQPDGRHIAMVRSAPKVVVTTVEVPSIVASRGNKAANNDCRCRKRGGSAWAAGTSRERERRRGGVGDDVWVVWA